MPIHGGVSKLFIAGLVFDILSIIALVVATALPLWSTSKDFAFGLFMSCDKDKCRSFSEPPYKKDAWRSTRAMVIMGTLAVFFSFVLSIVHIVLGKKGQPVADKLPWVIFILNICGGIMGFLAAIIWADNIPDKLAQMSTQDFSLNAAFGVCIVGGILAVFSGLLLIAGARRHSSSH